MSDPDIIIIGAGAAGIGAGLDCAARGLSFVILEGADRVGGRAYTASGGLERTWDWGCHWLHCATENPLVAHADRLGARYDSAPREDYVSYWKDGFASGQSAAEAEASFDHFFDTIYDAGKAGQDIAVSDVMPPPDQWRPTMRMIFQLLSGDDPEVVSAAGYSDYADVDADWPVLTGYGALIAAMAQGLPIHLGTPVRAVRHTANGVEVDTDTGTLRAKAAIVTVSANVLQSGAIAFGPGPAADLVADMETITCGSYEKVAFTLTDMPAEFQGKLFTSIDTGNDAGPLNFQIVEDGAPMVINHIGGTPAREVSAAGPEAMIDLATQHLVAAFGAEFTKMITGTATTSWTEDPLILGSYSHAQPGSAQLRRDIIARDTGRVGFAGEAFSLKWQATAHGAYQSGRDVVARMAGTLSL
ncbi:FAD-dependent oxidoreductase [Roseovarius sp. LXJ103]|uniref:flavin monoamine oxidase family protein n=1 Tax=Roseovarius carneus TaxID=2853164 RepID=UPI0015E804D5|nr:NAD(P)/FAD-dependent oxidoreductase [Roseovarius carneus]MBZ8118462.1 FAD-dependent oxidoreductase [Roseovarius carneus]